MRCTSAIDANTLRVEAFVAQPAIEALDERVLHGLAWTSVDS